MLMSPRVRNAALTVHVVCSVGWLGAVAVFLALAISGLTGADAQRVRALYLAMDATTSTVIVPLCIASLATGLVQSLGTPWGLVRHYWVLAKLLLTIVATLLLLVHTRSIEHVASTAAVRALAAGDLRPLRAQLVFDAVAALAVLLVNTTLSVYKPRGLTPYGARREGRADAAAAPWGRYLLIAGVGLVVLGLIKHLVGGGHMRHGSAVTAPGRSSSGAPPAR